MTINTAFTEGNIVHIDEEITVEAIPATTFLYETTIPVVCLRVSENDKTIVVPMTHETAGQITRAVADAFKAETAKLVEHNIAEGDAFAIIAKAMQIVGADTFGDLTVYCGENDTNPRAIVEYAAKLDQGKKVTSILDAASAGMSPISEIAKDHGVTEEVVNKIIEDDSPIGFEVVKHPEVIDHHGSQIYVHRELATSVPGEGAGIALDIYDSADGSSTHFMHLPEIDALNLAGAIIAAVAANAEQINDARIDALAERHNIRMANHKEH